MADPVKAVMQAMMGKMVARLSPTDIQGMMREMMPEMMRQMVSGLNLAQKTAFLQTMMGACIPQLTEGLSAADRERLATSIASQMAARLREAEPTATDVHAEQSGAGALG